MRRAIRNYAVPVLGLATVFLASPALATPFKLTAGTVGLTAGDATGWVNFTGSPPVNNEHVFVGPLNMTVTDLSSPYTSTQQQVYCTDIFANFVAGGSYTLSSSSLIGSIGLTKTNEINALLTHVSPASTLQGAAVQSAIWEILNETSPYNISNPIFTVRLDPTVNYTNAQFATQTNYYLTQVTTPVGSGGWGPNPSDAVMQYNPVNPAVNQTFGFIGLSGGGHNVPIQEPSAFSLFGLSFLGLAMIRLGLKPRLWI